MPEVYINRLSTYLPNEPISNDEMENVLGLINGKNSKAKAIVLRNNGIKNRHYAFKNGKSTHTNAEITATAIKGLFKDGKVETEILTCGTSSPDQLLPSHAAMTLGVLNTTPTELYSPAGACCTSIQGLKYAFMAIRSGEAENAVCAGSEKFSTLLDAAKFDGEIENLEALQQNGFIAFEKDFLRYMLSDGAAAAYLSNKPNQEGVTLRLDWIDMTSYSNELDTCMYLGCVKDEEGNVISWKDMDAKEWRNQSVFATKQDPRLLGENIVRKGIDFLEDIIKRRNLNTSEYKYFLPHLSSEFFRMQIHNGLIERNISIPLDIWFTNLDRIGNIGSASPLAMLDELVKEKPLQKGDKIFMMIPESSRFLYAYIQLTVV